MSKIINLAEKALRAFEYYGCYVFESDVLEDVKRLLVLAEVNELVEVKLVDEKYPYIYIATAWTRAVERECVTKVKELAAKNEIPPHIYKRYYPELVEQCILSKEKEMVKEIINRIRKYLERMEHYNKNSVRT